MQPPEDLRADDAATEPDPAAPTPTDSAGPDTGPPDAGPTAVQSAWTALQTRWDDEDAHARFIGLARTLGELAYAGGQYREVAERGEERAAMAKRQIDAVVAAASAELFARTTPRDRVARPWTHIAATVIALMLLVWSVRLLLSVL